MTDNGTTTKADAIRILNSAFKDLIVASSAAEEAGDEELAGKLNDYAMRNFRMKQGLTRKPREAKAAK